MGTHPSPFEPERSIEALYGHIFGRVAAHTALDHLNFKEDEASHEREGSTVRKTDPLRPHMPGAVHPHGAPSGQGDCPVPLPGPCCVAGRSASSPGDTPAQVYVHLGGCAAPATYVSPPGVSGFTAPEDTGPVRRTGPYMPGVFTPSWRTEGAE